LLLLVLLVLVLAGAVTDQMGREPVGRLLLACVAVAELHPALALATAADTLVVLVVLLPHCCDVGAAETKV
jgi:hypothetical protein